MSRFWTFLTHVHAVAGPVTMLLYPLYASVMAIESPGKEDDEQWLAYWIIYSFLTLSEMLLQSVLEWVPIWYTAKLVLAAWLVLPQFKGAAFLYERFVRAHIRKHLTNKGSGAKGKSKFVHFVTNKKGEQEAY
ncbi:unnamed protein product [Linum trigynum]|uniref:HVA22-like protein n=1 Tax=Linum trigynum TaxID=586398 RepID=A0AAV2G4Z0_9ROSI